MVEEYMKKFADSLSATNTENDSPLQLKWKEEFLQNCSALFGTTNNLQPESEAPRVPVFLPVDPHNQPATDILGQIRDAETPEHVRIFVEIMSSNNNANSNQPQFNFEADPNQQQPDLPGPSTSPHLRPRILVSSVSVLMRSPSPSSPSFQSTSELNKEPEKGFGGMYRIWRVINNKPNEDDWAQDKAADMTTKQRKEVIEAAAFALDFKERRKKLRISRVKACCSINEKYGTDFKCSMLFRFETLNLSLENTLEWRRTLEKWIIEMETSKNSIDERTASSQKPPALSPTPTEPAAAQDVQPTEEDEEEEEEEDEEEEEQEEQEVWRPSKSHQKRCQRILMRKYFSHNRRPDEEEMQILAEKISMDEKSVCRWFEKERHRAQDIDDREYRTLYNFTFLKETDFVFHTQETGEGPSHQ